MKKKVRELEFYKTNKEKISKEYSEAISDLKKYCWHPKKYIKYKEYHHSDEYGVFWYTTYIHNCSLCGESLGQYR
jgi:hypothetical protein